MMNSKVAQIALALSCFLLPFLFYPFDAMGKAAGYWTRGRLRRGM